MTDKGYTEYVYGIDNDDSDESEVFVGWIRKFAKVTRCEDCKYYWETSDNTKPWCGYFGSDGFCSLGERKEE